MFRKLVKLSLSTAISASLMACPRTNTENARGGSGEAAANEPKADAALFDPGDRWGLTGAPMKGAPDAVVTIVEWSDFQCPFCTRVNPTIKQIFETPEFQGKVRLVFMQHPLPMHADAPLAHQAALAAHEQGKFWEMHDLLFENQRALKRENLDAYATQLGLDMVKFAAALDNGTFKAKVDSDMATAARIGVRGTPNFMINGKNISGAQPFDAFAAAIRAEIAEMDKLTAAGKSRSEAYAARLDANAAAAPPASTQQPPARPTPDPAAEMFVPVENSPVKGAADALVTIAIFSDFQCPFCTRVNPTLKQVMDTYGADVRIVWKNNPLSFHDRAKPAAVASIAAHKQGKFWEYHDLLFANQQALTDADLLKYAEQLGLNMDKFKADLADPTIAAGIDADLALGTRLAAQGTPHFFVNGIRLRGAQPFEKFKETIDRELAKAQAMIASGTPRAGIYDALQADAIKGPAPMITPPAAPGGAGTAAAAPPAPTGPVNIEIGNSPSRGPANAPVTIVEWTDYQCPYCSRFATSLDEAIKGYEDKVRVVVKSFPLPFHQQAPLAHEASLAAHAQGKFWEYYDILWQNQRALTRPDLEKYAEQIGLDLGAFKKALDDGTYKAQVEAETAAGRAAGVTGTPAWYINGMKFGGARPADQIRAEIEKALNAPR